MNTLYALVVIMASGNTYTLDANLTLQDCATQAAVNGEYRQPSDWLRCEPQQQ